MSQPRSPLVHSGPRRPLLGALAIVGVGILALTTAMSITQAASAVPAPSNSTVASGTDGLNYVALGDSYAAGYGIDPSTFAPVPGCGQSTLNYPHQVATELGLELTDVSCSAALTSNITTTPQETVAGTAPIQLGALSADTDVVSLTIGGNDIGFSSIAASCIALSPVGPLLLDQSSYSCAAGLATNPLVLDGLENLAGSVVSTLSAVKQAAPNAKIFVVGYPAITPDPANIPLTPTGCFTSAFVDALPGGIVGPYTLNSFPFTTVDTAALHTLENTLDGIIHAATLASDATYVEAISGSIGHSACEEPEDAYLNGLTFSAFDPVAGAPTLAAGALHPNLTGATYLASILGENVRAAFPDTTATPTPTATPTETATAIPTETAIPSAEPTATETPAPTATATPTGTATPTAEPTATPAPSPTAIPSETPTAGPTGTPSSEPTSPATAAPVPTTTTLPPTPVPPIAPTLTLSDTTLTAGSTVTISASGFTAFETGTIWVHSTPFKLAEVTADANGSVTATVKIPQTLATGTHRLELRMAAAGSLWSDITITAAESTTAKLAATGVDIATPLLGGMIVIALGGLVLALARRRNQTSPHSTDSL